MTLENDLRLMCDRCRYGARATQGSRKSRLQTIAKSLKKLGFNMKSAQGLKPKHVSAYVSDCLERQLKPETIMNRLSDFRFWARSIGKANIVKEDNIDYGVFRAPTPKTNKAKAVSPEKLARVWDENVRMSMRLIDRFGFRREEAIKIVPRRDIRDSAFHLKATKGGRPRVVPIPKTPENHQLIKELHQLADKNGGSLIPPVGRDRAGEIVRDDAGRPKQWNYITQRNRFDNLVRAVGLNNPHAFRHNFAQNHYEARTGWPAPARGGPRKHEMTKEQFRLDRQARQEIAELLGHDRIGISDAYLGSAFK